MNRILEWLFAPRPLLDAGLCGGMAVFFLAFSVAGKPVQAVLAAVLCVLCGHQARKSMGWIKDDAASGCCSVGDPLHKHHDGCPYEYVLEQERNELREHIKRWHDEMSGSCGVNWKKSERIRAEMREVVAPTCNPSASEVERAAKTLIRGVNDAGF